MALLGIAEHVPVSPQCWKSSRTEFTAGFKCPWLSSCLFWEQFFSLNAFMLCFKTPSDRRQTLCVLSLELDSILQRGASSASVEAKPPRSLIVVVVGPVVESWPFPLAVASVFVGRPLLPCWIFFGGDCALNPRDSTSQNLLIGWVEHSHWPRHSARLHVLEAEKAKGGRKWFWPLRCPCPQVCHVGPAGRGQPELDVNRIARGPLNWPLRPMTQIWLACRGMGTWGQLWVEWESHCGVRC